MSTATKCPVLYPLDSQQIRAGKHSFGYSKAVEAERRFIICMADIVKAKEAEILERNGGDKDTLIVRDYDHELWEYMVTFKESSWDSPYIDVLKREPSFNQYLESIVCIDWKLSNLCALNEGDFINYFSTGKIYEYE